MLKAAKAYLITQVSTASQGDLLLMLYDTAIKHLRQAIDKMRDGDVAAKGVLISKALAIISELQESLNKERGGDISKNLFQLYFFCNSRLLMANLKMRTEMVEEVITILSGLRQAFAQILPTQDGVASLAQSQALGNGAEAATPAATPAAPAAERSGGLRLAPRPAASPVSSAAEFMPTGPYAPVAAAPAPRSAPETPAPAAPAATPGTPPEAPSAPAQHPSSLVNTLRLRAASAYANTR
jgi:flagellar protein FliS